jgi:hypothetical protein
MSVSFLDIQEDILIKVFSEWCQVYDIVRLDNAFCVKVQRDLFLVLLKDKRMPSFDLKEFYTRFGYKWFYLRNIRFRNVVVENDCESLKDIPADTYCNIMALSFISLKSSCDTDFFSNFMNSCSNLKHLTVNSCCGIEKLFYEVKRDVWHSLTKISLSCINLTKLINIICVHCCQLTSLNLSARSLKETHLKAIMSNNPSITDVTLKGNGIKLSFFDFFTSNYMVNMRQIDLNLDGQCSLQTLFPLFDKISSYTSNVRIGFTDLSGTISFINYYNIIKEAVIHRVFFDLYEDESEDSDSDKLCRGLLKTLDMVDKQALSCWGCMDELWERHKVVPFVFIEKLALVRLTCPTITDTILGNILKANLSLVSICLDINVNQEHPNYLGVRFLSESCKLKLIRVLYGEIVSGVSRSACILF